jgi:hypothetical protein
MIIPGILFFLAVFSAIVDPVVGLGLFVLSLVMAGIRLVVQRVDDLAGLTMSSSRK